MMLPPFYHLIRWCRAWVELVVAIIKIITLGLYRPDWDYVFLYWEAKRGLEWRSHQRSINKIKESQK